MLGFLFIGIMTSSCSFFRETLGLVARKPLVQLRSVSVLKANLDHLDLQVAFLVENPNIFDLSFSDLKYTLKAEDLLLASGEFKEEVNVPSDDKRVILVPINVKSAHVWSTLKLMVSSQKAPLIHWYARAYFKTPVGYQVEVGFSGEKILELSKN